jgi:serine/threonine protein kinase
MTDEPPNNSEEADPPSDLWSTVRPDQTHQEILDCLADQYVSELRSGKKPSITDYENQRPELSSEIRELLTSVGMIEELKLQSSRSDSTPFLNTNVPAIERLGDYRIVRELGRGGMGIVYQAVHESLGRTVAIKVLQTKNFENPDVLMRFRKEAKAAANLHHTNIVNVFGVGEVEGLHYYVMEYVDGCSLAEVIGEFRHRAKTKSENSTQTKTVEVHWESGATISQEEATTDNVASPDGDNVHVGEQRFPKFDNELERCRWSARIIAKICDALDYSHRMQILHRDIKPGNLLLDRTHRPWITDFGLVKELSTEAMTKTGDLFGTPQYMAPESLQGQYDCRSEVYCIGLTLYELIATVPVISETSPAGIFNQITNSEPPPLHQVVASVPRDLETIIHKSIQREPDRRYLTAGELRDDLERFLVDRPIYARRVTLLEKTIRWRRRNPLPAALIGLSVALLMVVAAVATYGYLSTNSALTQLTAKHRDLMTQEQATRFAEQAARESEKQTTDEFRRAESNVDLAMQAFDEVFRQLMSRGVGGDVRATLELDDFAEFSSLETSVTAEDARILQSIIKFYEEFTKKNEENEELLFEIAKACRRVANIHHLTGDFSMAQTGYFRAVDSYRRLMKKNADDFRWAVLLAETQNELAIAYRKNNQIMEAFTQHRQAMRLLKSEIYLEDDMCQFTLAKTFNHLCTLGPGIGGNLTGGLIAPDMVNRKLPIARERALNLPRAVLEDRKKIAERRNQTLPRDRAAIESSRRQFLSQATTIAERLIKKDPDNADYRLLRAKTYHVRAVIWGVDGQKRWETTQLRQACNELELLVKDFPDHPTYKFVLANMLAVDVENARTANAIEMKTKAENICQGLSTSFPQVLEYLDLESHLARQLAKLYISEKEYLDAGKKLRSAQRLLLEIIGQTPKIQSYYFQYAEVSLELADLLIKQQYWKEADQEMKSLVLFLQNIPLLNRWRNKKAEFMSATQQRLRQIQFQLGNRR